MRLAILREHGLTLANLQAVIATMEPLPGAVEFLNWARSRAPVIIITDSFYPFVQPFIPKLNYPTVFAHELTAGSRRDADRLPPAAGPRQTKGAACISRSRLPHHGRG